MSIATEITRIANAKTALKNAINAKGGTLTNELLGSYAAAVTALPSGESAITGIVFNGGLTTATAVQVIPTTFTSGWTNFSSMFYSFSKLTTIPQFDTSSGTNFSNMFSYCTQLTTISQFDTSNGTNFSNMFYNCYSLTTVPALDTSNGNNFNAMFQNCSSLITFGGLLNCKGSYSLSHSTSLTHDSLMNAINGLYDLTGQTGQTLTLGATNLAKLSDAEKAIATNKNWTLA